MRQRCNISVEKMIDIAQYKKSILNAISQAKTDHALEIINNLIAELESSYKYNNELTDIKNSITMQMAQSNRLKRDENLGLLSFQETMILRNRLANSVLQISEELTDNIFPELEKVIDKIENSPSIQFDLNYDSFSEEDKLKIENALKEMTGNEKLGVLAVKKGSSIVVFEGASQSDILLIAAKISDPEFLKKLGIGNITLKSMQLNNTENVTVDNQTKREESRDTSKIDNQVEILEILMLTANPAGTTSINIEKEHSRIAEKLQGKQALFNLTVKRAVNRTEFKEFTEMTKPTILHFSGHGVKSNSTQDIESISDDTRAIGKPKQDFGGIIVQNEDKNGLEMLSTDKLEALFQYFKDEFQLKVVILNACHSEEQALIISKYVPYVIGTTISIKDDYAISFSVGFYFKLVKESALNTQLDIKRAYESGKTEAILAGANNNDFVIYKNAEMTSPTIL